MLAILNAIAFLLLLPFLILFGIGNWIVDKIIRNVINIKEAA